MVHANASEVERGSMSLEHRATAQLQQSGLATRALGVGDQMPGFALPDHNGNEVRSSDLLTRGPLVLTFFRGIW